MALICEFGTAPVQQAAGYTRLLSVVNGTDAQVAKRFHRQDVRLVRGDALSGEADHFEFAVLVPGCPQSLGNRITGPYSAIIDGADTGFSGCTDASKCPLSASCLRAEPALLVRDSYIVGMSGRVCRYYFAAQTPSVPSRQQEVAS